MRADVQVGNLTGCHLAQPKQAKSTQRGVPDGVVRFAGQVLAHWSGSWEESDHNIPP
jgi:hypothetical protein